MLTFSWGKKNKYLGYLGIGQGQVPCAWRTLRLGTPLTSQPVLHGGVQHRIVSTGALCQLWFACSIHVTLQAVGATAARLLLENEGCREQRRRARGSLLHRAPALAGGGKNTPSTLPAYSPQQLVTEARGPGRRSEATARKGSAYDPGDKLLASLAWLPPAVHSRTAGKGAQLCRACSFCFIRSPRGQ